MRYEYVGGGKSRDLDIVAVVADDGNVVGAGRMSWFKRRTLTSFADDVMELGAYVAPEVATRGGQYEIVTVRSGAGIHQVVFENTERRALEVLRDAVEDLR